MAERSGHSELDRLIEAFMSSSIARFWELDRFRQTAEAEGRCYDVAEAFTQWLGQQDPSFEYVNAGDFQNESAWYGYEPEPWSDPTHAATAVRIDGYTYTIDWTASQYEVEEFPCVKRTLDIADKPVWERYDGPDPEWEEAWALDVRPEASSSANLASDLDLR